MAFKLIKHPTFTTTATLLVPTDDGQIEQTMGVQFKVLPPEDEALEVDAFLARAVLRLDDVVDDQGVALPSNPDLIAAVIVQPFVRVGLMKAYWGALSGHKLGN